MTRKYGLCGILAAAGLLAMTSCSPTTLQTVWKDNDYRGGKLKKVLIIAADANQIIRRKFEDEFVRKLDAHGTAGVASYRVIASDEISDRQVVDSAIRDLGIDAVLVTRLVSRKKEKEYSSPPYYSRDWYGWYSRSYVYPPSQRYYSEYEVVNLETNIYATRSGKMIWSALSDTVVGGSHELEIQSVIDVITKNLVTNHLLGAIPPAPR
ncbi:MAG: hypothetical protein JSW39_12850 [Desulfobacterales bacterium]|nr:MAG: hypothetical protein JSW39_12850 [Desulfobacterales bacterium]